MGLVEELDALEARAKELIASATDSEKLEAARVALLGKKGEITQVMHMMGKVAPEERPVLGKRANELRRMAEGLIERAQGDLKREAMANLMATEAVDVTLPGARPTIGHAHLINQIKEEIEDVFCGIGYTVESGPEVETSWYNFTALNAPIDHPSRSARDTFYVVDNAPGSVPHPEEHAHGESDVLLRTQTSGVQIHIMEHQKPPIYAIVPGTVYRPDTADACHLPQFNQVEGLAVDEGITFGDLKGTLDYFAKAMFGPGSQDALPPALLPLHRAQLRARRFVPRMWRQGLQLLQAQRLDRDLGLRHDRPQRARELRRRSGALHRLRVRHWRGARRGASLRPARPAYAYDGRYALLEPVLAKTRYVEKPLG